MSASSTNINDDISFRVRMILKPLMNQGVIPPKSFKIEDISVADFLVQPVELTAGSSFHGKREPRSFLRMLCIPLKRNFSPAMKVIGQAKITAWLNTHAFAKAEYPDLCSFGCSLRVSASRVLERVASPSLIKKFVREIRG